MGVTLNSSYSIEASHRFCTHSVGGSCIGGKHQKVGNMGGALQLVRHSIQQGSLCYSTYLCLGLRFFIIKRIKKKKSSIPKCSVANTFQDELKKKKGILLSEPECMNFIKDSHCTCD